MAVLQKPVHWASIVHESGMISFIRWLWFPEGQPSRSMLSHCCLGVAEGLVPLLLWMMEPIRSIFLSVVLARILYRLIAGGHVRRLFGPSVDLQKLCDSYHYRGEMGLPRELIDGIMRYNDLQTLKSCSLTSKAFYSATRPLIHRRLALGVRSVLRGCSYQRLSFETVRDQADVFHARYLSAVEERGLLRYGYVREVDLDLRAGNSENILQLQQLRALETVDTLTIKSLDVRWFLPIFGRSFSQFVPTLRSLTLYDTRCENIHQLMEFVCRFPRLDDLTLVKPGRSAFAGAPLWSKGSQPQQHLPFRGRLTLDGIGPLSQCLLDLPGGIRFHSISANSSLKDLAKLLAACSSTLKVFHVFCFDSGRPSNLRLREASANQGTGEVVDVSLGRNGILEQFELHVDFAELDILPPFLHKALTSISSPHFSEFSLRLFQPLELDPDAGTGDRKTLWGAGWDVVDEDLYAHAARRDDFRFVVQIVTGESTEAAVEALFPRMKSNGSLFITQQQPR